MQEQAEKIINGKVLIVNDKDKNRLFDRLLGNQDELDGLPYRCCDTRSIIDNNIVNLTWWDASTASNYSAMVADLYKDKDIICFVFDPSTNSNVLNSKITDIKNSMLEGAELILVARADKKVDKDELQKKFPEIESNLFVITDDESVADLKSYIENSFVPEREPSLAPFQKKEPSYAGQLQLLEGFIVMVGIISIIIAFLCLDAATFGIGGIILASCGVALVVASGAGFFRAVCNLNKNMVNDTKEDENLVLDLD